MIVPMIKAQNVLNKLITLYGMLRSGTGGMIINEFEKYEVDKDIPLELHENVAIDGIKSKPRLGSEEKLSKPRYFGS